MPLHGFPGAARRDAHLLVVVAGRSARREGVVEPEAMLARDAVGDIREGRGALVGGDHQIRVVAVVADHVLRRHHALEVEIVGDVEQGRHENPVGRDTLGLDRLAIAGGKALRHEAALGADRNDHGVLDLLRLDEAEHLGAEILRPVRPPDAAARHRAEAQMHRFEPRRAHEDLEARARQRHGADLAAVELDRDDGSFATPPAVLIEIGADRRLHGVDEMADDAVLVEARRLWRAGPRYRPRWRPGVRRAAAAIPADAGSKRTANSATMRSAIAACLTWVAHM